MRESVSHEGTWIDVYIMSMLDREWKETKEWQVDASQFDIVVVSTVLRLR